MRNFHRNHSAFVLGMYETGLGVSRSLARRGIPVLGFDHKKDVGFFSRHTNARLCPHPIQNSDDFISFLLQIAGNYENKPILFVTSDEFMHAVIKHRDILESAFLFNFSPNHLLKDITDKYQQFLLARKAGIPTPNTWLVSSAVDLKKIINQAAFPVFIKAQDVNLWRERVSQKQKGLVIASAAELFKVVEPILQKHVFLIIQEIITGPDQNHCKFCSYISANGEMLLRFTLRKIRQFPIHFGIGCSVESSAMPDLADLGERFFRAIGYRGVGSVEFKYDDRDGQLKLIELNPRYWQQNALADRCGLNFPLVNYLDVTGQSVTPQANFETGIKWINPYLELASFLDYRREGTISWRRWRISLRGRKIYSDLAWDDWRVILYSARYLIKPVKRMKAAAQAQVNHWKKRGTAWLLSIFISRVKKTWTLADHVKILIQTNSHFTIPSWQNQISEKLSNYSTTVEFQFAESRLEFIKLFPQAQICFCTHLSRHVELTSESDRFIYLATSGLDSIADRAIPGKTVIYNQRGIASEAIADYCLMTSLMLVRNFSRAILQQPARQWNQAPLLAYKLLKNYRVAILGVGHNGKAVAKRFHALGCETLGCDLAPQKSCGYIDRWFDPSEVDVMIQAADILIITLPLNETTRGLVDAQRLAYLGENGFLINVGRGEIVKEQDLYQALKKHAIAGAAIDTFAQEPLAPKSRLWSLPNLIISPHIAGNIHSFVPEIQADFVSRLLEQLEGKFAAQIKRGVG